MADVSKLYFNGASYDIKDVTARSGMMPTGGTTGYILKKNSNTDYDAVWGEYEGGIGIPDGGTKGQILVKNSDSNGDISWYTPGNLPSPVWYLPAGVSEHHVIAAYQFVGRNSEEEALTNVNHGMEFKLTKSSSSVTWNSETGFFIPATQNEGFKNDILNGLYLNIYSAAFGYANLPTGLGNALATEQDKAAGGLVVNTKRYLTLRGIKSNNIYLNYPAMNSNYNTNDLIYSSQMYYNGYDPITGIIDEDQAERYSSGVIAGNWDTPNSMLFRDGATYSGTTASYSSRIASTTVLFGQFQSMNFVSFYVTAFVLYNITLSLSQHEALANNIRSLGGINS